MKYCPGVKKNEIIKFNAKQVKKLKTIILTDVPRNSSVLSHTSMLVLNIKIRVYHLIGPYM